MGQRVPLSVHCSGTATERALVQEEHCSRLGAAVPQQGGGEWSHSHPLPRIHWKLGGAQPVPMGSTRCELVSGDTWYNGDLGEV